MGNEKDARYDHEQAKYQDFLILHALEENYKGIFIKVQTILVFSFFLFSSIPLIEDTRHSDFFRDESFRWVNDYEVAIIRS